MEKSGGAPTHLKRIGCRSATARNVLDKDAKCPMDAGDPIQPITIRRAGSISYLSFIEYLERSITVGKILTLEVKWEK
jgi:hypothetical protein